MSNRRRAYRRTTSRRAPAKRGGGISKINLKNVKRPAIFKASFWDKKRIIIAASAAAAIILAIVLICVFTAKEVDPSKVSDEELYKMKYKNGISIEGIDVSGMVFTDAAELVGEKANDILGSLLMRYSIEDTTYTISAYDMGASIDYPSTMKEAMFGEKGDYKLKIKANESKIKRAVSENCESHSVEAKDALPSLEVNRDEKNLMISAELVISDEQTGKKIDEAKLANKIKSTVEAGETDKKVEAEVETQEPKWTKEFMEQNMNVMGEYTTQFKDSSYNRRYNIWKMSGVVCGVVLMPGETWSINEAAGDRTAENGWKDAAGIKNGAYVDEPGGGICQVSSTLYNAILRSEVTVVDRSHHSWPLTYVPVGLDATISTGSPDFVIKNPYDTPIVLAVRCDAGNDKTVRVRVYGPAMDYKLDFTSEIVKETEPEPQLTTTDPSMSPGTSKEVSPRHNALTVNVYKHVIDKQTGEEKEKTLYSTEYYAAFRGTIAYGPEPTQTPEPSEDQDASKNPDASKDVQQSKKPEDSKKPA